MTAKRRFIVVAAACGVAMSHVRTPYLWGAVEFERSGPWHFALSLARNDVPGGIVVSAQQWSREGRVFPTEPATGAEKAAFRTEIAVSIERFNREQAEFRAVQERDVVHVRSVGEPPEVTNALGRLVTMRTGRAASVIEVMMNGVVGAIRGTEPKGWIGSGLQPGPECSLDRSIHLPEGSLTAVELLDEVARQAPGLVWYMSYVPEATDQDVRVGLICPDGTLVHVDYP